MWIRGVIGSIAIAASFLSGHALAQDQQLTEAGWEQINETYCEPEYRYGQLRMTCYTLYYHPEYRVYYMDVQDGGIAV